MSVTPSQFDLVSKLLDVTALRQRVLGQNVANVNTPGYQRSEVVFEQELQQLVSEGGLNEVNDLEPSVLKTQGVPNRSDGNNVDIDLEMGQLSKNGLLYQTYTQILTTQLSMIRSAINGRP